jgi:hypothetical protein
MPRRWWVLWPRGCHALPMWWPQRPVTRIGWAICTVLIVLTWTVNRAFFWPFLASLVLTIWLGVRERRGELNR